MPKPDKPPRRAAVTKHIRGAEWIVHDGKPCLEVDVRGIPEKAQTFAIRIPDADAFRVFIASLMDAGIAAFPEIAAEHAFVNDESVPPAGVKPS